MAFLSTLTALGVSSGLITVSATGAVSATALGTAVGSAALSAATAAVSSLLQPTPGISHARRTTRVDQEEFLLRYIFGRQRVHCYRIWGRDIRPKKRLIDHYCVDVLGEAPLGQVQTIWQHGEEIEFMRSGVNLTGQTIHEDAITPSYTGREFLKGAGVALPWNPDRSYTDAGAQPPLKWTGQHKMQGRACVASRFSEFVGGRSDPPNNPNETAYDNGYPLLDFLVSGYSRQLPGETEAVEINTPARATLTILELAGIPAERIDVASFQAGHRYEYGTPHIASPRPTPQAWQDVGIDGPRQHRFLCDYTFVSDEAPRAAIESILQAGDAQLVDKGGKIFYQSGALPAAVGTLEEKDFISQFPDLGMSRPTQERVTVWHTKMVQAQHEKYGLAVLESVRDEQEAARNLQGDATFEKTVTYQAVTDPRQAHALTVREAVKGRNQKNHTFTVGPGTLLERLSWAPGDVINVVNRADGFASLTQVRIDDIVWNVDGDLSLTLAVTEVVPQVYEDFDNLPAYTPISALDFTPAELAAPSDVRCEPEFVERQDGHYQQGLRVTWLDYGAAETSLWVRPAGGGEWEPLASVGYAASVRAALPISIEEGSQFDLQVVHYDIYGNNSPPTILTNRAAGSSVLYGDVPADGCPPADAGVIGSRFQAVDGRWWKKGVSAWDQSFGTDSGVIVRGMNRPPGASLGVGSEYFAPIVAQVGNVRHGPAVPLEFFEAGTTAAFCTLLRFDLDSKVLLRFATTSQAAGSGRARGPDLLPDYEQNLVGVMRAHNDHADFAVWRGQPVDTTDPYFYRNQADSARFVDSHIPQRGTPPTRSLQPSDLTLDFLVMDGRGRCPGDPGSPWRPIPRPDPIPAAPGANFSLGLPRFQPTIALVTTEGDFHIADVTGSVWPDTITLTAFVSDAGAAQALRNAQPGFLMYVQQDPNRYAVGSLSQLVTWAGNVATVVIDITHKYGAPLFAIGHNATLLGFIPEQTGYGHLDGVRLPRYNEALAADGDWSADHSDFAALTVVQLRIADPHTRAELRALRVGDAISLINHVDGQRTGWADMQLTAVPTGDASSHLVALAVGMLGDTSPNASLRRVAGTGSALTVRYSPRGVGVAGFTDRTILTNFKPVESQISETGATSFFFTDGAGDVWPDNPILRVEARIRDTATHVLANKLDRIGTDGEITLYNGPQSFANYRIAREDRTARMRYNFRWFLERLTSQGGPGFGPTSSPQLHMNPDVKLATRYTVLRVFKVVAKSAGAPQGDGNPFAANFGIPGIIGYRHDPPAVYGGPGRGAQLLAGWQVTRPTYNPVTHNLWVCEVLHNNRAGNFSTTADWISLPWVDTRDTDIFYAFGATNTPPPSDGGLEFPDDTEYSPSVYDFFREHGSDAECWLHRAIVTRGARHIRWETLNRKVTGFDGQYPRYVFQRPRATAPPTGADFERGDGWNGPEGVVRPGRGGFFFATPARFGCIVEHHTIRYVSVGFVLDNMTRADVGGGINWVERNTAAFAPRRSGGVGRAGAGFIRGRTTWSATGKPVSITDANSLIPPSNALVVWIHGEPCYVFSFRRRLDFSIERHNTRIVNRFTP